MLSKANQSTNQAEIWHVVSKDLGKRYYLGVAMGMVCFRPHPWKVILAAKNIFMNKQLEFDKWPASYQVNIIDHVGVVLSYPHLPSVVLATKKLNIEPT